MHDPVGTRAEGGASESGAARLKKMLGPVEIDGGKAVRFSMVSFYEIKMLMCALWNVS